MNQRPLGLKNDKDCLRREADDNHILVWMMPGSIPPLAYFLIRFFSLIQARHAALAAIQAIVCALSVPFIRCPLPMQGPVEITVLNPRAAWSLSSAFNPRISL